MSLIQPNVKLIPADPMTNTILILYCVNQKGTSVPYKAVWRKINTQRNIIETLKTQNSSSYRCSPLDLDCYIEATVSFQHGGETVTKVVQSHIVKASRDLKDRKRYAKDALPCQINIGSASIECKIVANLKGLNITSMALQSHLIEYEDIKPQAEANQQTVVITFKKNLEDFLRFYVKVLGWQPQIKAPAFTFMFKHQISRDLILLGIAENDQRKSSKPPPFPMPKGIPFHQERPNSSATGSLPYQFRTQSRRPFIKDPDLERSYHTRTAKDNSFSPNSLNDSRSKPTNMVLHESKKYFKQLRKDVIGQTSSVTNANKPGKPSSKQYLNVFEDDDDWQMLNATPAASPTQIQQHSVSFTAIELKPPQDKDLGNCVDLRGSFEQLQRNDTKNSDLSSHMIIEPARNSNTEELEYQLDKLRKENEQLRKQADMTEILTKENSVLKRRQGDLQNDLNRLEAEKKQILENLYREMQEKQGWRTEAEHLRELLNKRSGPSPERGSRTSSHHDFGLERTLPNKNGRSNTEFMLR